MVVAIKGFDESKAVEMLDVDWHATDSERFEFNSTSKNQETGFYDSEFTVDGVIVAEKPGEPKGQWQLDRKQMGLLIENWDELSKTEQNAQMDMIEELIPRIEEAHFSKIKAIDVGTDKTPIELTPCQNLGEICEAKAQSKEWEDKLFVIKGYIDGHVGEQTFGISAYRPPGNKDGGFLNLFRKRKGLPESFPKKWEPMKIKTNGNKPSSMVAMKSYSGQWNWSASVLEFFETHVDNGNGSELDFGQICSEYPNSLMVKLFNFCK